VGGQHHLDTPGAASTQHKTGNLTAKLHDPIRKVGVPFRDVYSVTFNSETIVTASRVPELDAARVLLARGITGTLTVVDAVTGKPCSIINIEKAARLTVEENRSRGPRFARWAPLPANAHRRSVVSARTGEDAEGGQA
jgi:hypothetical protein